MNFRFYSGIGSRKTPMYVQEVMTDIAILLVRSNYVLRSGGADAADQAFELGVRRESIRAGLSEFPMNIFYPTEDPPPNYIYIPVNVRKPDEYPAVKIAAEYHPAWNKLRDNAKELHTRNVFQVLGPNLNRPSEFVLCWTVNGKASGGTGQALRIAKAYKIPIYNLHNLRTLDAVKLLIGVSKPITDFVQQVELAKGKLPNLWE